MQSNVMLSLKPHKSFQLPASDTENHTGQQWIQNDLCLWSESCSLNVCLPHAMPIHIRF
ncbi:hypothetical protein SLEP1_g52020 [Rubroshorea leprosula]|uniref:Uncharacterized protein n=1 Tax=Rubroshorea leprosula TaxID=152421 RepID=A0AAV5M7M5_9ROSI|nr:hypothetical protein SLEP1_g52020 [Rubroshorea leprosula]